MPKDRKKQIDDQLEKKIGRKPISQKEVRLRAATVDILTGDPTTEAMRRYALQQSEISQYLRKLFPTDEERFEFLESCMIANSMIAMQDFQKNHGDMEPADSAKAAAMFAGKALEIKKARENGFKEAPINIGILLSLERTLASIQPAQAKQLVEV